MGFVNFACNRVTVIPDTTYGPLNTMPCDFLHCALEVIKTVTNMCSCLCDIRFATIPTLTPETKQTSPERIYRKITTEDIPTPRKLPE